MKTYVSAGIALLLLIAGVQAQETVPVVTTTASAPPSLRVHGDATVSAEPNQAEIDIGVVTQAASAKEAGDKNALQTNAVIQQLRQSIAKEQIKTENYSLNPDYKYPKEGGTPTIAGYTANNTVQVTVNDLSQLGKLIDETTSSGANAISGLRFKMRDENEVRGQALAKAAQQAKAAAEALAGALGVTLGPLLRVEEGSLPTVVPVPLYSRAVAGAMAAAPPTPISAGTIDVRAQVDLTYGIQ